MHTLYGIALLIGVLCASSSMGRPGARQKIAGAQNDLQLGDLAKFAVEQYNEKQNSDLQYVRLVSAEQQVVAGIVYYLDLEAVFGGDTKLYEAKVWVKPWENFKSLEDFEEKQSSTFAQSADIETHSVDPTTTSSKENMGMHPVSLNDMEVTEAAEQAMKSLQERSNSLVPYELKEISSAYAEITEASKSYDMLLSVQRGPKEEQFDAEVTHTNAGGWTVKDLRLHH